MNRRNATIISLFLALALVLGTAAMLRTAQLGARSTVSSLTAAQIAARSSKLDGFEAQLRTAASQVPPALPAAATPATARASSPAPARQPQQVIYVRPKPVVQTVSRHGEGRESEAEHGHERGEGELDD